MPVILPSGAYDAWLDPDADREELGDLLIPYPGDDLETYPVAASSTARATTTSAA